MRSRRSSLTLTNPRRRDERFDTVDELAARIHQLRKGAAIQLTPVVQDVQLVEPRGPAVRVMTLCDQGDTLDLVGVAFVGGGRDGGRRRLQDALRVAAHEPSAQVEASV